MVKIQEAMKNRRAEILRALVEGLIGTQSRSRSDEVSGTLVSKRRLRPRTQLDNRFHFLPVLYVSVVKISYSVSVTYVKVCYCYDELC